MHLVLLLLETSGIRILFFSLQVFDVTCDGLYRDAVVKTSECMFHHLQADYASRMQTHPAGNRAWTDVSADICQRSGEAS